MLDFYLKFKNKWKDTVFQKIDCNLQILLDKRAIGELNRSTERAQVATRCSQMDHKGLHSEAA